jgi:hypothetical protein
MTLENIKQKVRELSAKTRQDLIKAVVAPVCVAAISCFAFAQMHDPVQRWILALAFAWSLAGQYALHRGMRLATLPGDAAMTAALEYYRREVERRRALYQRGLLWSFGPIILALGAFCIPFMRNPKVLPNALPFMILVAAWIVGFFTLRMRIQNELQREIDDLRDIEKNNN